MGPLVSVITPCYNHAPFLDDYFQGLLAQTYTNVEVIIVDDKSTDDSWNVILEYQPRLEAYFSNVVCIQNERNVGFLESLYRIQQEVSGGLTSILESDDFYYADKVEKIVAFFDQHTDAGAVHSRAHYLYADEGRLDRDHRLRSGSSIPEGYIFEELLNDNFILTCTFCCRTELFKQHVDFREYARAGYLMGDYPLFLDLARQTSFGYIHEPLACYRVRSGSASKPEDPDRLFRFKESYYQIKLDYIERFGGSSQVKERAQRQKYQLYYRLGFEYRWLERFENGYSWLRAHYPEKYSDIRSFVYAHSIRHRWLWKLVQWLEVSGVATKIGKLVRFLRGQHT